MTDMNASASKWSRAEQAKRFVYFFRYFRISRFHQLPIREAAIQAWRFRRGGT
jgi:hypothetical protein